MNIQKKFNVFVGLAGGISLLAFLLVLFRLDPCVLPGQDMCEKPSNLSLALFFVSLFFLLVCVFSGVGFYLRRHMTEEFYFDHLSISLRQGVLLALCAVSCLLLLLFGVLTWWSGFLLLATVFLIELFLSRT